MLRITRILLICENRELAVFLKYALVSGANYELFVSLNPAEGLAVLRREIFDIVIAEFDMFELADAEFVAGIKKIDPDCVLIGFLNEENERRIEKLSRLGVYDFIGQPVSLEKLFFLLDKGVQMRKLLSSNRKLIQSLQGRNLSLEKQNILLAERIEQSSKNLSRLYEDLRSTYMHTIRVLAQAIDARDHYTHKHSQNVARYAVAIGSEIGLFLTEIEVIREACLLHDLGKIGIEDNILGKPDKLTVQEWKKVRRHPITAAHILEPLDFLNEVIELVKQHHEHYDGSGYTEGRSGESIHLGARIIHLADAYDAMRSARSYRRMPFSQDDAVAEIKRNSGTQFDPKVTEAFLKIADTLLNYR